MADIYMKKVLKQSAVYWAPSGNTGSGQPSFEDPIEIACRWDDKQEEYTTKAGDTAISNAQVMVDRDLKLGGFLFLGTLEMLVSESTPTDNEGAYEIKRFNKTPNFQGKKFLRVAIL